MLRGVQWNKRAELVLLILMTPLLLFPESTHGLGMLGVLGVFGIRWLIQGHIIRRTPLDGSILIILLMVMISTVVTFDPALSLPKISGVVLGVACYYTIVEYAEDSQHIWWTIAVFIATGCAVSMISLIGTNWLEKFPLLSHVVVYLPVIVRGLPGSPIEGFHPNTVAGALIWVLPLQISLLWLYYDCSLLKSGGRWARLWLWGLLGSFLLIGATMVLTQSRGGYIGLFCGLFALFVFRNRHWLLIVGSLLLFLVSLVSLLNVPALAFFTNIKESLPSAALNTLTLQERSELWLRALEVIRDFPFTGIGMGTFRRIVPVFYPLTSLSPDVDVGHAHNNLLNTAVDLGIPGLIGYIALWLGAAMMAWKMSQTSMVALRAIGVGLSAGMLAHFVYGLTDAHALGSKPGLLLWLAFGNIAALYRNRHFDNEKHHR